MYYSNVHVEENDFNSPHNSMVKKFLKKARAFLLSPVFEFFSFPQGGNARAETQILLALKYKEMLSHRAPLPTFDEIGFGVYSGSDEDGILLYIFSLIGVTNKKLVDTGCDGIQGSNTANLIINHGWTGLLIDGSEETIKEARTFYSNCRDTRDFPPVCVHAWVTAENINTLISQQGLGGEVDLLSIDIDGVDYWIWKAISCISPRVVVVEYQDIIGPDKALTVPYRPDFRRSDYAVNELYPDYLGASLLAFVKLARQKGYRLVGCNRYGYNAFFMRSGVGETCFPEATIKSCFKHPSNEYGMEKRFPRVKDMSWIVVE